MIKRLIRVASLLLIAATATSWADSPMVATTEPANGATGVAGNLAEIVIAFDSEMNGGFSVSGLSGPWDYEWSSDHRTLTLSRQPGVSSWADGSRITIILNPPPYISFYDVDGNALGTFTFTFTVGGQAAPGTPTVAGTDPVNGAVAVSRNLENIELTFSEPMAQSTSISGDSTWPISATIERSWSADGKTLTISRDDAGIPLAPYTAITIQLNSGGTGFQDLQGTPLGAYSFSFTTGSPGADEKPVVMAADPENGESSAGSFIGEFSLTFSKPMESSSSLQCTTGNWQVAGSWWSTDRRVLTVTRADPDRLLPAGENVEFVLNPTGDQGFRDTDGNPLDTVRYIFTVESNSRLLKVLPEDSDRNFHWPYYLWIPSGLEQQTVLLVEPNNTGTTSDLASLHDAWALSLVGWRAQFAAQLGVPLLVPTFPRPRSHWRIYTHALDRDSLTNAVEGLERIDLQLIEMIDDARQRLANLGYQADTKVFMMGFSASGQFTNRFAILHPDRIRAAAAGSPGGWPLAPVSSWQDETLDYHVGIADVASLTGGQLDMAAVRAAPLLLYMGDADTNDSVPFSDGYDDDQRELVNRLFGTTPVERWAHAEEIYESAGMNSTFVLYPGVGHTITNEMFEDVAAFFNNHKMRRFARIRRPTGRLGPGTVSAAATASAPAQTLHRWHRPPMDAPPPLHEDPPQAGSLPPTDERCHSSHAEYEREGAAR